MTPKEMALEAANSLWATHDHIEFHLSFPTKSEKIAAMKQAAAAAMLRFAADVIEMPGAGHGADEGCIAHAIRLRDAAEELTPRARALDILAPKDSCKSGYRD